MIYYSPSILPGGIFIMEMIFDEIKKRIFQNKVEIEVQNALNTNGTINVMRGIHLNYGDHFPHFNIRIQNKEIHIFVYLTPANGFFYAGMTV